MLPLLFSQIASTVDPVNHQFHVGTVNFPFFTVVVGVIFARLCDADLMSLRWWKSNESRGYNGCCTKEKIMVIQVAKSSTSLVYSVTISLI